MLRHENVVVIKPCAKTVPFVVRRPPSALQPEMQSDVSSCVDASSLNGDFEET